ncbi:DUF3422 domain-containing protein [Qipengyuania qiaonensis]|uniref:DUF3422 domain-containing protein n=1 Tax=Qipengyuania qiaonensis TaxID=2867240 RepID=A0ABS7J8A5_9SPHN|nr:DUF3422 domain-containing protein [Qipengyuania qiaonensis]MBX7483545.1 DUF3422 domain-containing protein [Qipengyuania qiaonensis]
MKSALPAASLPIEFGTQPQRPSATRLPAWPLLMYVFLVNLTEHPLRRELVREMHLRQFAPVSAPASIVQTVLLVADGERDAEFRYLDRLAQKKDLRLHPQARHAIIALDDGRYLLWERHTEATTLTVIMEAHPKDDFSSAAELLEGWPGTVVRATKLFVEKDEATAAGRIAEIGFEEGELVCCKVNAGVTIWSDFRIRDDGFGRLLLTAGHAGPGELGRIVQRLQELGNYRNLALLGLPEVRRLTPTLTKLEEQLARYSNELGEEGGESDEKLMQQLSVLSAELARLRVESSYRLSASRAYAQIAMDRLDALSIEGRKGYQDLAEFTERRLIPGMRTCESFVERMRRLSERTGDAIALLNTRIDTRIKAQNLDLLRSMESSFNLQLRLQHLVEALSVIAAGYYAVGLIAFVLKGTAAFPIRSRVDIALAVLTPLVLLAIFFLVSRMRKRYLGESKEEPRKMD